jgi:hypothetical protein
MLLIQRTPGEDKIEDMPTSAIQMVFAQLSCNHCDSE